MYISPCAAHYYRQRFDGKRREQLEEQAKMLSEALLGLEEERAELEALPKGEGARLRIQIERDGQMMRAKLSAIQALLAEMAACGEAAEQSGSPDR